MARGTKRGASGPEVQREGRQGQRYKERGARARGIKRGASGLWQAVSRFGLALRR